MSSPGSRPFGAHCNAQCAREGSTCPIGSGDALRAGVNDVGLRGGRRRHRAGKPKHDNADRFHKLSEKDLAKAKRGSRLVRWFFRAESVGTITD